MSNKVVDLTALKPKMDQGATEAPGTEDVSMKKAVKTALLLICNTDGTWTATPDLTVADKIAPQEVPDGQAMIAGMSILLSDIQAEKTAHMTTLVMGQMAQAQMAAMQNAQIAQGLDLGRFPH